MNLHLLVLVFYVLAAVFAVVGMARIALAHLRTEPHRPAVTVGVLIGCVGMAIFWPLLILIVWARTAMRGRA